MLDIKHQIQKWGWFKSMQTKVEVLGHYVLHQYNTTKV